MTYMIDSITHRLNSVQIAKELLAVFLQTNQKTVHVVMIPSDVKLFANRLRVSVTRAHDELGIDKDRRIGVRTSEPFPYTFSDGREGKFVCIAVTPYHSRTKAIARSFKIAFKELVL